MSSTRRNAQEHVARYYESCLRELIEHVNTALYQYHRAARELWKFCWAGGGASHLEFVASLIDDPAAPVDWWQRGMPRRPRVNEELG